MVSVSTQSDSTSKTTTQMSKKIMVYVCGQVKKPGVYELSSDDRVVAAIKAAGGLTSKASATSINQAAKMEDGQQINIPSKKEVKSSVETGSDSADADDGKVNLNTASKEELMSLSGVGESRAKDILSYREEHGSFTKIEDIMNVQGIKEGIYNKIKDSITT